MRDSKVLRHPAGEAILEETGTEETAMEHILPAAEPAGITTALLAVLTHIDTVGFHGIATALTGSEPKIDRNWAPLIRNARIAVAVTAWPDELRPAAERFVASVEQLTPVLERRDTAGVADPAKELHIAYHALSDAGWGYLASAAGIPGGEEHGHGAQHGSH
ncbi:hypothetical protein QN084_12680 [Paenarthrobacter sp. R1]|uniref:hypothetical protein n=1 Tax=Paenarthrobacter sp. R1 TaxID=3049085 RepID=UPI00084EC73C|nr:hypothetical protein [Paenarthrobacter sp. R1]NKR13624.1 hypothetical protein [Arthrobacter sp. M5]NKR15483.1 hypothetical protein [Arthrobacter sp. M6]OEH58482.1 hypothetical protein A5N17_21400 [Arthrobacter sp. D2]OEH64353.1 hypothetical protein A5N13_12265 [Arthrobacter sp. D4]WIV29230.1 hypothetical protein QN084_12680 [Paenarthrobacter sp. R1]